MNDSNTPTDAPVRTWHGVGSSPTAREASLPPITQAQPAAADDPLKRVVQGVHTSIDRLADSAAPRGRQLEATVANAEAALQAKTDQILETRDKWSENLRTTVREKPLMAVAAALAIGALIARITR